MISNNLELLSLNKILKLDSKFLIPSYQRGYRWTSVEVEQLLTDVWDFTNRKKNDNEFYCLQPIVVIKSMHKGNDVWEVIDGQQRLTTVLLILKYLIKEHLKRPLQEAYKYPEYSIEYITREDSEAFFKNMNIETQNVDYFFMRDAYKTISEWFEDKDYNDRNEFLSILLAKEDKRHPVKVIWYEIKDDSSSTYDIFTRLNMGKIPLTNAELVKALFLSKSNFVNEDNSNSEDNRIRMIQLKIASEWDTIENRLQDDKFWLFIYNINNQIKYDTRIEYIFDLMKKRENHHEERFTFYEFNNEFEREKNNNNLDIEKEWQKIKDYFLTFEVWYKERTFYHLVGFLIDSGYNINDLKEESQNKTKIEFWDYLICKISKKIEPNIEELVYPKDKNKIKEVLLMFNIQTILDNKKSNIKFPFDRYKSKTYGWDVEHVRSKTTKNINESNKRKEWAKDVFEYFTGLNSEIIETKVDTIDISKLISEIINVIDSDDERKRIENFITELIFIIKEKKVENDFFTTLENNIKKYFREDEEPEFIDSISNLALLDATTNRSYGNAMFPIKRRIIMQNEMRGTFIPICTKNLFLKAYSRRLVEVMYWTENDANEYVKIIKETLKPYFESSNCPNE